MFVIGGGPAGLRRMKLGTASSVLLLAAVIKGASQDPNTAHPRPNEVIEITAKKYEFSPAEIRVKTGARVCLKVHSVDEDHGMKLSLYPEGGSDKSTPGLVFDDPQDNGRVQKGKDQMLEFVAKQAGTYEFKCAEMCGIHHGRMKGKLIVEP